MDKESQQEIPQSSYDPKIISDSPENSYSKTNKDLSLNRHSKLNRNSELNREATKRIDSKINKNTDPVTNQDTKIDESAIDYSGEPTPLITYIDECVFHILILLYILWRIIKTSHFSISKALRGNMRAIGTIFILASSMSLVIFNGCLIYLSRIYDIDHGSITRLGHLTGTHITDILGHKIDIVRVLNISTSLANIFKVSSIFILIGLWLPCAYSFAARRSQNHNSELSLLVLSGADAYSQRSLAESLSHASIVTFATLYSICRIPIAIFIDMNVSWGSEKTVVFYGSLFYGSELTLAVLFFLILKTRFLGILQKTAGNSTGITATVENVNLLVLLLLVDTFVNHYINILDIPVELTSLMVHIMKKVSFVCWITSTVVITSMLAPMPRQIYDVGGNEDIRVSEKPFWRPNDVPRLGFESHEMMMPEGGCVMDVYESDDTRHMINADNSILEYTDFRNGLPNGK